MAAKSRASVPGDGTTQTFTSMPTSSVDSTPTHATAATPGSSSTSRSTSKLEMFSPRRRIASRSRSTKKKSPASLRRKRSPVWNQPPSHARAVASGSLR